MHKCLVQFFKALISAIPCSLYEHTFSPVNDQTNIYTYMFRVSRIQPVCMQSYYPMVLFRRMSPCYATCLENLYQQYLVGGGVIYILYLSINKLCIALSSALQCTSRYGFLQYVHCLCNQVELETPFPNILLFSFLNYIYSM